MNSVNAIEDLGLSYYKKPPGDQWFDGYIDQRSSRVALVVLINR